MVFYASPWSPPAFMKTNKNMLRGGKLLPEFRQAWANYYAKFIKAYENEGIPVWGLTIQNEPMAVQRWESCIYTAAEERDFLKNYLGPTLEKEGLGEKKIIVWDHNRDLISERANTIFEDKEAAKYAWGIGFHWYETWTGGLPKYDNLKNIKESFPSKNMMFTEGCQEGFDTERMHYWPNAERYGNSMINDFNSGVVVNKVSPLGVNLIVAKVYRGESWMDGKDTIIIDYSSTSLFAQKIRDEIREIEPGLYLGKVWLGKTRILDFALETHQVIPA